MRNKSTKTIFSRRLTPMNADQPILFHLCSSVFIFMLGWTAWGQQTVAPTPDPVGSPRGDNFENYNILQSFELGYRWRTVGGDEDMYRSTVNYGDGIRLLSSSLYVKSRDGHGGFFDEITITTQGLGNDPYQSAILRIEKNRLYRYDLTWRSTDYFNPALTISNGEHFMDTTRQMQDHDLTLFPQSAVKLFLGYSRNVENGPALTTIQLFNSQGDEFPLFQNLKQQTNEYRAGGEINFWGFRLNAVHGWEDFKDDTTENLPAPSLGTNPNDLTTLSLFNLSQPYHGTSPYWRVALFREGKRRWAMNGRFTYVAGRRAFEYNELSSGTTFSGALTNLQVLSSGNAQRPAATGNLTLSLFPAKNVTVTNQTSAYNIRMIGTSVFVQEQNGVFTTPVVPFQYLGIETIANATDVDMRLGPWLGVHAGYEFSYRQIGSIEDQINAGQVFTAPDNTRIVQTNELHTGVLGFRFKPIKPLTVSVDGEIGRADKPIYPISEKNYQALRGRIEYKRKSFRAAVYAKSDYNTNSTSLTSYASQSRQYGVDGSWTANEWFSIDASYAKLDLYTLGGINYFVGNGQDISGEDSLYLSNIHTASLGARFTILKRVDLYLGYSHVQDVGDGRSTSVGAGTDTSLPAFQAAQTFPVRFLSPEVRLSVLLHKQIRWNAGYQYYGYEEQFSTLQNFRAQTGYSSVSWSF